MVDRFESRQSTSECALQVVTEPDSAAWPCLLASRARRRPRLKKRRLLPSSVKRLAAHASSGFFFDGTIRPSKRLPIAQLPATSHIKPAITGRAEHALPIITSLASCCRRRLHLALSIAPDAGAPHDLPAKPSEVPRRLHAQPPAPGGVTGLQGLEGPVEAAREAASSGAWSRHANTAAACPCDGRCSDRPHAGRPPDPGRVGRLLLLL